MKIHIESIVLDRAIENLQTERTFFIALLSSFMIYFIGGREPM